MSFSLTPNLERIVDRQLASGKYTSTGEVIDDALKLLEERNRLERFRVDELRRQIAVGVEQIEREEFNEYDETTLFELLDRVKAAGRRRLGHQLR